MTYNPGDAPLIVSLIPAISELLADPNKTLGGHLSPTWKFQ